MIAPFFTIIVPVYNVQNYIERCLLSLVNQNLDDSKYEIRIVNDGTPDDSMRIVQKYSDVHKNIVIINKKNGGVSSARNMGIMAAKGKYLLFVDPDDEIALDSLQNLYDELLKRKPQVLIVESTEYKIGSNKKYTLYPFSNHLTKSVFSGLELFKHYRRGAIWGVAFLKSFVEEFALMFNENLTNLEDALFFNDTLVFAKKIILRPIDYYIFHEREGSASKSFNASKIISMLCSSKEVFYKLKRYENLEPVSILYSNLLFDIISNCCFNWVKLPFSLKNFYLIKTVIKKLGYRPIPTRNMPRQRFKMQFFNFSLNLFILVFYIRQKCFLRFKS
jgi:glycosyltransferase involved in cell wall biosynthesis